MFKSSDKALQDFLDKSVTQKILSYMKTDSEYKMRILGDYEYDMSLDGYISIVGRVNNIAEMSNGYPTGQYTFFVDLKNKKVLSLKDLFSNSESEVYEEIALKTNKYGQQSKISSALFNNSLLNYDYEKAKFNLNEGYLTMIFDPYEVASGVVGTVRIEIPVTDIELNSVINGVNINSIKP